MSLTPLDAAPDADLGCALPEIRSPLPGARGRAWIDRLARSECPAITARRARRADASGSDQDPIVWERALGANVWDPDGNRFVDLTGGFGVASAGHAHPAVIAAVTAQLGRLVHGLGDAFPGTPRIELADALADRLPGGLQQTIFGCSGSEAVEAALKTAMMATGRAGVVAFEGGYHGLSLGVLPVSHYRASFREPFAARLGPSATFLPYGGPLDAVEVAARDAGAILVEPVQGRGGCRVPPAGWLRGLRDVADRCSVPLIFDEIFTGFGRAGSFVLSGTAAADGVVPDLLCLGKGLTSGFPLSACVGTVEVMAHWGASRGEALHTSTYLGHPVGCAAALAVLGLCDEGLVERGAALGALMEASLVELAGRHPGRLGAVRGRGAMRGLEVRDGGAFTVCRALLQRGWLVLPAGVDAEVLCFTPPLTTTAAQWAGAVDALEASL